MGGMEEPSLFREIAQMAWLLTRVLVAIASVMGLLLLLSQLNGVLGWWIFWGLVSVALVVYAGWQSYTWKKQDWKRQQEQDQRDRQWQERERQWQERHRQWREARERRRA